MHNIIIFILSISIGFSELDLRLTRGISKWHDLSSKKVNISWTNYKNFPIVRAKTVIDHPINLISDIIGDLNSYPNIFKRIKEAKKLDDNIVHIIIDMPFPFNGRDYVVKYDIERSKNKWMLTYASVVHPSAPIRKHTRLPNAAGIWELKKIGSNKTEATHIWNGELLGNFPEMGLDRAWLIWGEEIFDWLNQAL